MMGRPSFEGVGEKKKSMFMPLGVAATLFIKQANQDEATSALFCLSSTSKEDGEKSGPSYPNYTVPAGHGH